MTSGLIKSAILVTSAAMCILLFVWTYLIKSYVAKLRT